MKNQDNEKLHIEIRGGCLVRVWKGKELIEGEDYILHDHDNDPEVEA